MSIEFDYWRLLAGLGIFLFGMILIEESVRALSGRSFRRIIRLYTNGRLKSIGSGSIVTALLQSSSAVSLMVLAFVGAGVMSMENAIGVIMGSNIGTTLTAWIVAIFGFKVKIESLALPFIGVGAIGTILFRPHLKLSYLSKIIIGFGFLFLGLDYMKGSVENIAQTFNLSQLPNYGLWFYMLVGALLTAIMQASAATIAIVLTALNSQLITFEYGMAMVIGANVGTTITVLLGSIGGVPAKKRVALSHLIFNMVTGFLAFFGLPIFIWIISILVDLRSNSLMGLAIFHTLFNVFGVLVFYPIVGLLSRMLVRFYPDYKPVVTIHIDKTPIEITDAATVALKNEILHLLQECWLYNLRLLRIDEKLVFEFDTPFMKNLKKKLSLDDLYENIKRLHAEIFTYYSKIQSQKLNKLEAKDLARLIYASRNIMNALKNFKGIRLNMDEFDSSDNAYINSRYVLFRKRLLELYHDMSHILQSESSKNQYQGLMAVFAHVEKADNLFINNVTKAVSDQRIQEIEISSLLLVNRLFTQSCRMQVYSMKDLLLSQEQVDRFDQEMDKKELEDFEGKS